MTKIIILLAILVTSTCVKAQITESKIVRAGEDLAPAISPNGYYRFPQFTEGILTMKNGNKSKTRLNFNIAIGEMQFIDPKGDTLAIAQTQNVNNIDIGANAKFINIGNAYYEVVGESSAGKLGKKIRVQIANDKKDVLGSDEPNSSNLQFSDLMTGQRNFTLSYDVQVKKTTSFYWIDDTNSTAPVTKKNTLRLVESAKRAKLQAYMDENNINLNKEEDLLKLLAFAATL